MPDIALQIDYYEMQLESKTEIGTRLTVFNKKKWFILFAVAIFLFLIGFGVRAATQSSYLSSATQEVCLSQIMTHSTADVISDNPLPRDIFVRD